MRLSFKQLKKLTVETLSGTVLGRVQDIIFDTEGQNIIQYVVKHGTINPDESLVSRDQIVRFEERKIVVYDTAARKKERTLEKILPPVAEGVSMRQNSAE